MHKFIRVVFTIALIALSVETWAIEISAVPGFSGKCKPGTWIPITVRLKNPGHDRVAGTITTLSQISNQASPYHTRFDLPGPSEKRYTHYVLQEDMSPQISVKLLVTDGTAMNPSKLTVDCPLTLVLPGNVLFVAVGSAQSSLNFLDGQILTITKGTTTTPASSSIISASLIDTTSLPDRVLGYDSVDILVLSDFSPGQADTKQLAAIKMWVAGGGILVINGGPNFQRLQNQFYSDMLPVDVAGATEVNGLGALTSTYGYSMMPGSCVVTTGNLRSGAQAVVMQGGLPLISSRSYGLGQVYFLAFDYTVSPIRGWDGQSKMWKDILLKSEARFPFATPSSFGNAGAYSAATAVPGSTPGGLPAPGGPATQHPKRYYRVANSGSLSFANPVETIAGNVPSITMPSMSVIVIFLLGYLLCLVPINYYILAKRKRRELAWITTPIIIIIFTLGAYGIGYSMKGGKLLLKTVTVVESSTDTRYGAMSTYFGLFSPSRRTYDIEINDPYAVVSEATTDDNNGYARQRRSKQKKAQVLFDGGTSLPDAALDMWAMKTFRVESGCDLGGTIESDLRLVQNPQPRIVGTIKNGTIFPLKKCMIVNSQVSTRIPDIPAGSSARVDVELQSTATTGTQLPGAPYFTPPPSPAKSGKSASEVTQSELEAQILPMITSTGDTALVGWCDKSPSNVSLRTGRGERQTVSCFIFRLLTQKTGGH